jgi:hypothetical protein
VAYATLSPDDSIPTCAPSAADQLVATFSRLHCPNSYRRFADTPHTADFHHDITDPLLKQIQSLTMRPRLNQGLCAKCRLWQPTPESFCMVMWPNDR